MAGLFTIIPAWDRLDSISNQPFGLSVSLSGWGDINNVKRLFKVDGVAGTGTYFPATTSSSSAAISVSDTNWHVLTIISPVISANARAFTSTLTGITGQQAVINESDNWNWGYTYTLQYGFQSNVTLTLTYVGGNDSTLQAMFFDTITNYSFTAMRH